MTELEWSGLSYYARDVWAAQTTQGIAISVAAELGAEWKAGVKPHEHSQPSYYLTGVDGAHIDLRIKTDAREKLIISGMVPNRDPKVGWGEGAGISTQVSHARGPKVIANEIKRRFLPEYLPKLEAAKTARAEAVQYQEQRLGAKARVLDAFQAEERGNEVGSETFSLYYAKAGYGDVQVYPTTANIRISSVPIALAVEIGKVFSAYRAKIGEQTK